MDGGAPTEGSMFQHLNQGPGVRVADEPNAETSAQWAAGVARSIGPLRATTAKSASAPSLRCEVVCYCVRGEARRIIGFGKANKREERACEAATANR